ncbi:hypothetical protein L1987_17294 [Smallanthus sonchifolius]|uniref:Uncharacterized protein n=1 Tax=Smallanthus sonchifolius TaxID=185202 RepID=A0ACB9IYP2_9ASTR|nr:hypothetical protein L1987_17294 [Smallanthus sonchifolius]
MQLTFPYLISISLSTINLLSPSSIKLASSKEAERDRERGSRKMRRDREGEDGGVWWWSQWRLVTNVVHGSGGPERVVEG